MTSTPGASPGHLLVIEDEDAVAKVLVSLLESEGFHVARAANFDDVQRLVADHVFDLATCDIMMPGTNGLEVLAWLREHRPDTGVIMATAVGDLDTVITAMRHGAYSYLLKPFNLDLVSQEIARAMERQRLVAENREYQQRLEEKVEEQTRELRVAHGRLERQVRELEARDRLVHLQSEGAGADEAYHAVLESLEDVLSCRRALIYRVGADGGLRAVAGIGLQPSGRVTAVEAGADSPGRELVDLALAKGQPVSDGDLAAVPLQHQETTLGAVWVDGVDGAEARDALWRLGRETALVLWTCGVSEQLDSGQLEVDQLLDLE